jgi:hypothetical protein
MAIHQLAEGFFPVFPHEVFFLFFSIRFCSAYSSAELLPSSIIHICNVPDKRQLELLTSFM